MEPAMHDLRMRIWCAFAICLSATSAAAADGKAGPEALATPPDLAATLFAAEPLLSSPADIDVDAHGRVWVCEVVNYRGKRNTRPEGDRILVLEDTDGDGVADKQTVFHQGRDVDSALGICVIGVAGQGITFRPTDLEAWDPSLVIIRGQSIQDSNPVQVVQHVSQLSVAFVTVPRVDQAQPKRPIGFHAADRTAEEIQR